MTERPHCSTTVACTALIGLLLAVDGAVAQPPANTRS